MLKFLEVPDFHLDPKWIDQNKKNGIAVKNAAIENEIDFIVCPGDFNNSHLIATEKGGLTTAIEIVKSWLRVCPVVMLEGTPSHDGPGAYAALEEAGIVLLKPMQTYIYVKNEERKSSNIFNIKETLALTPDCILFGIPELNKKIIQYDQNLPAEEANATLVKWLGVYIEKQLAPERLKYENIPAILALHGVVSDSAQVFSNDIIVKSSDIVIKTEMLERAGMTRCTLGHIHTPWESKKISAGYAGSWGTCWGEVGFIPSFNMVELDGNTVKKITRIPYGTPQREKIKCKSVSNISDFKKEIAYWIESETEGDILPAGLHPLSKLTIKVDKKEARRITVEQAAEAKTLADLFKLFDPGVTGRVIEKVNKMESGKQNHIKDLIDVKLESIEIKGCDFWKGKTIKFDLKDHSNIMLLIGDNGEGKSALVSFCHPYPTTIGKDPSSGKSSSIKEFFSGKESSIEKTFNVNGQKHKHLITLKGAHTDNCKVECYLYIDGKPILETGAFSDMMSQCEELYGPYDDYVLTTFYVQPLQGKTGSSLMTATLTEIRNLVQSISGINRESEKRIALDNIVSTEKIILEIKNWLDGAESGSLSILPLSEKLNELQLECTANEKLVVFASDGKTQLAKLLNEQLEIQKSNNWKIKEKERTESEIISIKHEIENATKRITELEICAKGLDTFIELLNSAKSQQILIIENDKMKLSYDKHVVEYNNELSILQDRIRKENNAYTEKYNQEVFVYNNKKSISEMNIKHLQTAIEALNKPCKNCGFIEPDAKDQIEKNKKEISTAQGMINNLIEPVVNIPRKVPAELDRPVPVVPSYHSITGEVQDLEMFQRQIDLARDSISTINSLYEQIAKYKIELNERESVQFEIDPAIDQFVNDCKNDLEKQVEVHHKLEIEIARLTTEINLLKTQIVSASLIRDKIETKRSEIIELEKDLEDWKYIAAQLQPAKIPAMELDIILDDIDREATKNIAPYYDGIFTFSTETQQEGKKNVVDKFDIKIRDNETGEEKSFIKFSPGQKAFFNDAYVKALIMKRNDRARRNYSPIISDEADQPIKGDFIPAYYEMQQNYYESKNSQVIIISHAVNAHTYIQHQVRVKELLI